ncbi:MAG: hypothetical protein QF464_08705 [Myxococcota bacterium]|nr:hypothetical protein [Myxococcota bacterium]
MLTASPAFAQKKKRKLQIKATMPSALPVDAPDERARLAFPASMQKALETATKRAKDGRLRRAVAALEGPVRKFERTKASTPLKSLAWFYLGTVSEQGGALRLAADAYATAEERWRSQNADIRFGLGTYAPAHPSPTDQVRDRAMASCRTLIKQTSAPHDAGKEKEGARPPGVSKGRIVPTGPPRVTRQDDVELGRCERALAALFEDHALDAKTNLTTLDPFLMLIRTRRAGVSLELGRLDEAERLLREAQTLWRRSQALPKELMAALFAWTDSINPPAYYIDVEIHLATTRGRLLETRGDLEAARGQYAHAVARLEFAR